MLASTMQFSNNEPSPTSTHHTVSFNETGSTTRALTHPQDPTACPTRPATIHVPHPKAVLAAATNRAE
jgi:hypothetical protein